MVVFRHGDAQEDLVSPTDAVWCGKSADRSLLGHGCRLFIHPYLFGLGGYYAGGWPDNVESIVWMELSSLDPHLGNTGALEEIGYHPE